MEIKLVLKTSKFRNFLFSNYGALDAIECNFSNAGYWR